MPIEPDVDDDTAWHVDPLPEVDGELRNPVITSWLADGPSVFDVTHDATARFYVTNSGASPCSFEDDPGLDDLVRHIPMGYTNLYVYEKRAVLAPGGRLVRVWPRRLAALPSAREDWGFLLPHQNRSVRHHPHTGPIEQALAQARVRSASQQVPAVIGRLLWTAGWH